MLSLNIILTQKANKDEIDIYKYITDKFGEVYADKFRNKLIALFHVLSNQPFIGRPAKNDLFIRVIFN